MNYELTFPEIFRLNLTRSNSHCGAGDTSTAPAVLRVAITSVEGNMKARSVCYDPHHSRQRANFCVAIGCV